MKEKYIIRHKYWLSTHLWFYWRCWHDVCWWCWNGFGKLRNVEMLFYSTEYLNLTCVNITSWCQQPPWCTVMTMSHCHGTEELVCRSHWWYHHQSDMTASVSVWLRSPVSWQLRCCADVGEVWFGSAGAAVMLSEWKLAATAVCTNVLILILQ